MLWYGLSTCLGDDNNLRSALVLEQGFFDLEGIYSLLGGDSVNVPEWVRNVTAAITGWTEIYKDLDNLAHQAEQLVTDQKLNSLDLGGHTLLAPFKPNRIFAAASNYTEHANEMETVLAEKAKSNPYVFMKAATSVIGTGDSIIIPPETEKADWEVELGVVIGKAGRRIKVADSENHIAGFTVVNDISARDMTRRDDFPFKHDWFRGKSFDTFCPMGPCFVPRNCVENPHDLKLGLSVNGEVMQDGNTGEMIFNSFEQIAYISSLLTLQPGDLIATGTPKGVGMGRGIFLKPGDVVSAYVERIGTLTNPVKDEPVT